MKGGGEKCGVRTGQFASTRFVIRATLLRVVHRDASRVQYGQIPYGSPSNTMKHVRTSSEGVLEFSHLIC